MSQPDSLSWWDDIKAGSIAGIVMVLCSHPFDTVKVRMQMDTKVSMFQAAQSLLLKEGALSFYKGVQTAMFASFPISVVTFSAYEGYIRDVLKSRKDQLFIKEQQKIFLGLEAGAFSGLLQSFVASPAELIKCVLQMQFEYLPKQYTSPLQCMIEFTRQEGIRALYKGFVSTLCRDIPQIAVFFSSYEYMKYSFSSRKNFQELNLLECIVSGSIAGLCCILASYPFDVIKTMIQCEITTQPEKRLYKPIFYDGGVINCTKAIYKVGGLRGFWVGFDSCALFYIVNCSTQLVSYDLAKNYYLRKNKVEI